MKQKVTSPPTLEGQITPPGDKSISHRAAILNAISCGAARVSNFSPASDCWATVNCLRALGVTIEGNQGELMVQGTGERGLREAEDVLDAQNSATTMRLLAGLLASQPFLSIITGDESLRSRPMDRVIEPLRLMGAEVWGRGGDRLAPLVIKGSQLRAISYRLPVASAQVKSALMLAALYARGQTTIEEPAPSRDHMERLLGAMGANIEVEKGRIALGPGPLHALDIAIPGDISSAAYWLVAAAIHPRARVEVLGCGVNPTRSGILSALLSMGARVEVANQRLEGSEPVADLRVESSTLRGREFGGEIIPSMIDELPLLAVAAAVAEGTTVIRDAAELRVKESDRISTTVAELSKLGARIEELPDGMVVHGGAPLHSARCSSHNDHRLAMTLAIAALAAEGETTIDGAEASAVSYLSFWQDLGQLSRR